MTQTFRPAFGFDFGDFYRRDGLARLDAAFVDFLKARDVALHDRLMAARAAPEEIAGKAESELILALAPILEDFVAELFGIVREMDALKRCQDTLAPLYSVKRLFVQRRAAKKFTPEQAAAFDGDFERNPLMLAVLDSGPSAYTHFRHERESPLLAGTI